MSSSAQNYTISVIVLSHNRAHLLSRLLQRLGEQNISQNLYEIIVSDDGSTDATGEIVRNFQKKTNIIFLRNAPQGVANSRNEGLRLATKDLVVFLADDYLIPNDFLGNILSLFDKTDIDILRLGTSHSHRAQSNFFNRMIYAYELADNEIVLKENLCQPSDPYRHLSLFKINNVTYSGRCVFKRKIFTKLADMWTLRNANIKIWMPYYNMIKLTGDRFWHIAASWERDGGLGKDALKIKNSLDKKLNLVNYHKVTGVLDISVQTPLRKIPCES